MNDVQQPVAGTEDAAKPTGAVRYVLAPEWARPEPPPTVPDAALEDFTDQGVLRILHDSQLSLRDAGIAIYLRAQQRVVTRAGAERAANLAIEFDPSHERLDIHSICVLRGPDRMEHARPGAMQLLQRESQLERLALNGRFTASLVIPDLREGDQLEVAFTRYSALPVFSGRCSSWLIFNAYAPWIETRIRILRPLSRQLTFKPFNSPPEPQIITHDDAEERRWTLLRQKRLTMEDLMPSWTIKNPGYQASEFTSWANVAAIFSPHYQDTVLPPELVAICDQLRASGTDPAMLAIEWLRHVQRTLRYFATSLGEGGLIPRGLGTIWARRFGDCKDAARLYVAGARRLGLDACAALVSTTHGLGLNDVLPSTDLFNHVIVRLRSGEHTYWLDPTLPSQAGSLRQQVTAHAGWALPLTPQAQALEALPAAEPVQVVQGEDSITLGPKPDSPAKVLRRVRFGYWTADRVRHRIANDGASKVATQLLQELHGAWPGVVETTPPTFEEDTYSNQLVMQVSYDIRDPWKAGKTATQRTFAVLDGATNHELSALQVARRHSPILLGRPRRVRWRATVEMPCRWAGTGWHQIIDEPGLRFTSELKIAGGTVTLDRELTISEWSMPADKADAYVRVVGKVKLNITNLFARVRMGRIAPPVNRWRRALLSRRGRLLLIAVIFLLYELILDALHR